MPALWAPSSRTVHLALKVATENCHPQRDSLQFWGWQQSFHPLLHRVLRFVISFSVVHWKQMLVNIVRTYGYQLFTVCWDDATASTDWPSDWHPLWPLACAVTVSQSAICISYQVTWRRKRVLKSGARSPPLAKEVTHTSNGVVNKQIWRQS